MASIPQRIKRNRKLVPIRKYFKVCDHCLAYRIFWSAYISNKKRITYYKEVVFMWWMINAAGERVFTVESEEAAIKRLDDWYINYVYVG